MTGRSLRLRLIAGGAAAILIALSIAGVGLTVLFERHVTRNVTDDLELHLKQLLSGIAISADGQLAVTRPPVDPRFADPLSGLYWQVSDDRGGLVRSRSLWDATLPLAVDQIAQGEVHLHELPGPGGARLLVVERRALLAVGDKSVPVRAAVAVDLARVSAAGAAFARDLMIALGILGLVLALATSVQVLLGLRPLDRLRSGVARIRSGESRRLQVDVPVEVLPLVEEVNGLLDARDREIERSRGRAADLAHGLKTPLAALLADAERLRERGELDLARDIEAVGEAMSRHVDRELARARVQGSGSRGTATATELEPLLRSLVAILARTPDGQRISYEIAVPEGTRLPLARTDLAEVLGNLLDNATRHARARIRIAVGPDGGVAVEDDGPGIAATQRLKVTERGMRLDQRGEGAGLGLAIVQEVLEAYGWQLELGSAELGGLKAICRPGG